MPTSVSALDPATLKPSLVNASGDLKQGITKPTYEGGTPQGSGEIKAGWIDSDGNLKASLVDAEGNLKPSLKK